MKPKDIYTVEYSVIQHCYHVDTLDKTLETNLMNVARDLNNGYLVIGMFSSHDAATDFVAYHREAAASGEANQVIKAINTNTPFLTPFPPDQEKEKTESV